MARELKEGMKVRHSSGWTSRVVRIEGNRRVYLANGRSYPEASLAPADGIDPTTLDLIEAIDVYETGLTDIYSDDSLEPDINALTALRRSAMELIETIDLLTPPPKE